jgi:hypothetical protein
MDHDLEHMPYGCLDTVEHGAQAVRSLAGPAPWWITAVNLPLDAGPHPRHGADDSRLSPT